MFRRYEKIIIPDIQSDQNLTGDLTHTGKISNHPKLHYLGVFCSVSKMNIKEDIDYLFSVSGPEIQRTLFEEIILSQIDNIPGRRWLYWGNRKMNSLMIILKILKYIAMLTEKNRMSY